MRLCECKSSYNSRANSLAMAVKKAGDYDAPNSSATKRAMCPLPTLMPMYRREAMAKMAWWKPCRQSRFAIMYPMPRKVIRDSRVGKCSGRGIIARLIPVIFGSKYGWTSDVSFFDVQPSGLIVRTNAGWGLYGLCCG